MGVGSLGRVSDEQSHINIRTEAVIMDKSFKTTLAVTLAGVALQAPVQAANHEFCKDKNATLAVATSAGCAYDPFSRLSGRYLEADNVSGRSLPGAGYVRLPQLRSWKPAHPPHANADQPRFFPKLPDLGGLGASDCSRRVGVLPQEVQIIPSAFRYWPVPGPHHGRLLT